MTELAGAIGMAEPENAGIATKAQAARPISIERFIGVSLRVRSLRGPQQRRARTMLPRCRSSLSRHFENGYEEEKS
jgi:hypothetical protein